MEGTTILVVYIRITHFSLTEGTHKAVRVPHSSIRLDVSSRDNAPMTTVTLDGTTLLEALATQRMRLVLGCLMGTRIVVDNQGILLVLVYDTSATTTTEVTLVPQSMGGVDGWLGSQCTPTLTTTTTRRHVHSQSLQVPRRSLATSRIAQIPEKEGMGLSPEDSHSQCTRKLVTFQRFGLLAAQRLVGCGDGGG